MKQLIYILLLPVIIFGQSFNRKPVAGDRYEILQTDATTDGSPISPGNSGAGVVWDFSNLVLNPATDVILDKTYLDPSKNADLASDFPNANIVDSSSDGGAEFLYAYKLTNNSLELTASDDRSGVNYFKYSDYKTVLKYPLTMGLNFTDNFSGTILNGNVIPTTNYGNFSGSIKFQADGIGTLKLTNKTFNNVIRVKIVDTVYINHTDYKLGIHDSAFKFYYGLYPDPILEVHFYKVITDTIEKFPPFAIILNNFTSKIANTSLSPHIRIFPTQTESKSYIYFSEALNENARIELINILGETVYSDKINTTYNKKYELNIKNLPGGIYFLKITINNEYLMQKIIKL